jgi:hypothetical protein
VRVWQKEGIKGYFTAMPHIQRIIQLRDCGPLGLEPLRRRNTCLHLFAEPELSPCLLDYIAHPDIIPAAHLKVIIQVHQRLRSFIKMDLV